MSTIFGSNGDQFHKQGDHTFYNGANDRSDNIYHAGSSSYGNNGPMYNGGSVSSFGGGQIFCSGDTYTCNGQQYHKVGNTLYGPNGQRWYGDMTDGDIRDIISHNW